MARSTKTDSSNMKKKEPPQKTPAKPAVAAAAKKSPEAHRVASAPQTAKAASPAKTAEVKPPVRPAERKSPAPVSATIVTPPVKAIEKKAPAPVVPVKAVFAPAPVKAEAPAPVKKQPVEKPAAHAEKPAVKEPVKKTAAAEPPKGFIKDYLPGKKKCRVTFRLQRPAASNASVVTIVGDFNDWDNKANPMKKTPGGDFTVTIELAAGKEYRFRYLIDEERWENDWNADRYEPAPFGQSDNSVVVV
jgi:hypothetical protein